MTYNSGTVIASSTLNRLPVNLQERIMKLSKLLVAISAAFVAQTASAGVITVLVDDFSANLNGRTMAFSVGSGTSTIESQGAYPTSPFLNISVGATSTNPDNSNTSTFSLGYTGFALPTGASAGTVTFAALYNGFGGQTPVPNTVGLGVPTTVNLVNATNFTAAGLGPFTTVGGYNGGAITILFNSPSTRSWDILIDNVSASFNCGAVADATVSISQYAAGNYRCVPVPGSLALLGMGGLAAGLLARRRAAK
jgi:hypothetical protein